MNRLYLISSLLVGILCLLCFSACLIQPGQIQAGEAGKDYRFIANLDYAGDGHPRHKLDLYLPADQPGPFPTVIWIHGGAWQGGSKEDTPALALVKNGYAVASINYRLSNMARFPGQIFDCKAAVRYLRAHALDYKLDGSRFGVWGNSAGGHLAALMGTSNGVKELEGNVGISGPSSNVQCACDWCGPSNLLSIASQTTPDWQLDLESENSCIARLLGGLPEKNKKLARLASPVEFASEDDPPILIMHGSVDNIVPCQQSDELEKALKAKGVDCQLIRLEKLNHSLYSDETFATVLKFLDKNLKEKGGAV